MRDRGESLLSSPRSPPRQGEVREPHSHRSPGHHDREEPHGHEDHRLLRRHRERPRRARARAPARRCGRVARARVRPPRPGGRERARAACRARGASPPREGRRRARATRRPAPRHRQRLHAGGAPRARAGGARGPHRLRLGVPHGGGARRSADPRRGASSTEGPSHVALAPAGFAEQTDFRVRTIAAIGEDGDPCARETAEALASRFGATIAERATGDVDLVVVGSKPGTVTGRVTISAAAEYLIELSRCPVLVVPRGVALRFDG